MRAIEQEMAEARGAMKAQARNVTIIVAIIGALGLFAQISNRIWPVQTAQARPAWHYQAAEAPTPEARK